MPKFLCSVTQTTRSTFIIEAPDDGDAHELALDAFNNSKNLDLDTDCDVDPIKPGRALQSQASEKRLFWWTHFDCWNDDEDCDAPTWKWDTKPAVDLCWKLMCGASTETDYDGFYKLTSELYLQLGQVKFFEKVEELFISLGYDVYNSDTMFEVYHPSKRRKAKA